jgi:hypothetical protein
MDPGVGDRLLPRAQEGILFLQRGECTSFEGVLLDVIDAAFDLALVPGRVRTGGPQGDPIVVGEGADLGVDVGVEPVGLGDGGLEVVEDTQPRKLSVVWR